MDLLGRDLSEIARARRAARDFLTGSPEDVIAIAQLLTSELVTNALQHGSGDVRLSFDCVGGVLRVRVTDDSPRQPVLDRSLRGERGRGLLLVESMAMSWGFAPDLSSGGKTVWFRLRTG